MSRIRIKTNLTMPASGMRGILYRLDFASWKSYIGITTCSAASRFSGHAAAAAEGCDSLIYRAWRKHGAPRLVVLAILETHLLKSTERRAIELFGTMSPLGYNSTPGGEANPMHCPEIVAKMSGEHHPMKRPEMRARMMGDKNIAKRADIRLKISAAKRGNRNAMKRPEVARKVAMALKGRQLPESVKRKMSAARKGTVRPVAEYLSRLGKTWGPERRAKIASFWAARRSTLGGANA